MAGGLVAGLVGLALLDSINTSTLFLVMVVMLTARHPVLSAAAYAVGAVLSFLGLAIGLYAGASAAEAAIADLAQWLRRGTFALFALWLLYLGFKRLRDRPRKPFLLPAWFGPLTAAPIGVVATVADLPNAFPLFIAIERLTSAPIDWPTALVALVGYVTVYAIPIAIVIVLGVWKGAQARAVMQRVTDRFLSGTAKRSLPLAAGFTAAAAASASVAVVI